MAWPIGLAFAFCSAVATMVGFLMRHRGAAAAPDVDARKPVATVKGLFSQKWWAIGFGVAFIAWALHVFALKLAPLSYVQAVLASGFVFLGIAAERWFGFHLRKREWVGIALTASGLALLGLTAAKSNTEGSHSTYALSAAIAFEGALVVCGTLCFLSRRVARTSGHHGVLLGAGAGLLFTVTHIAIKALTHSVSLGRPSSLLTAWVPIVVVGFVVAFFASARSLQYGPAVPVIAVTSAISNVSAIAAGIVVFGDPLGSNSLVITLRLAAFALVVIAAALLPAPVRAAEAGQDRERAEAAEGSRQRAGRPAVPASVS